MRPTLVLDVVGLTPELLGADTPHLNELVREGVLRPLSTVMPAVTCSAQSTLLTGRIDESELETPHYDQAELFEGNSVLRGQSPEKR